MLEAQERRGRNLAWTRYATGLPGAAPAGLRPLLRDLAGRAAGRRPLRGRHRPHVLRRIDVLALERRLESRAGGAGRGTEGARLASDRLPAAHTAACLARGARDPAPAIFTKNHSVGKLSGTDG